MMTRDTETLAELMSERAGKRGSGLPTWEQISERAVDPESGYRPSANLLWKVASGQDVKVNPQLVRAIAAGFSLPVERVRAAAYQQFIVGDPFDTPAGDSDGVVRVAQRATDDSKDMPATRAFIEKARRGE
jgi:hypothetical protein